MKTVSQNVNYPYVVVSSITLSAKWSSGFPVVEKENLASSTINIFDKCSWWDALLIPTVYSFFSTKEVYLTRNEILHCFTGFLVIQADP